MNRSYNIRVQERDDGIFVATEHRTTPDATGETKLEALANYVAELRQRAGEVDA